MKKQTIIVLILFFVAHLFATINVLDQDENQIIVEFNLADYRITEKENFTHFSSENITEIMLSGAASNFATQVQAVLPENGSFRVQSIMQTKETKKLQKELAPVPTVVSAKTKHDTDVTLYKKNEHYRSYKSKLQVEEPTFFRSNKIGTVQIFPLTYNVKSKTLEITTYWKFKILIDGDKKQRQYYTDAMDKEIEKIVLNPDKVSTWKRYKKRRNETYLAFEEMGTDWYRFEISKDGFFRLNANDLSALPLQDIDIHSFRIFSTGGAMQSVRPGASNLSLQEIPLLIEDDGDNTLNNEDRIIFFANDRAGYEQTAILSGGSSTYPPTEYDNPYSDKTSYWLTWNATTNPAPNRILTESVSSASRTRDYGLKTIHFEENIRSQENSVLNWYSDNLSPGNSFSYTFPTSNIKEGSTGILKLGFQGRYDNNSYSTMRMALRWKNQTLLEQSYSNSSYKLREFTGIDVTASDNNITLENLSTSSRNMMVDFVELTYQQYLSKTTSQFSFSILPEDSNINVRYDFVSNDEEVKYVFRKQTHFDITRISHEENYFITTNNRNTTTYYICAENDFYSVENFRAYTFEKHYRDFINSNVESIIIFPEAFRSNAEDLASLHKTYRNLNTEIISLQNVFDLGNAGMDDPIAIRIFLQTILEQQENNALQYVTLFGSGTYDWKNQSGSADDKNNIIMANVRYSNSNVYYDLNSEDIFVQFEENSLTPQLAIGRITARNESEASFYVNRVRSYLENQMNGFWRNHFLCIADDEFGGGSESEIYHSQQLNSLLEATDKNIIFDEKFAVEYPMDSFRHKPTARQEIIDGINDGRLIWYYIGHGSAYNLGDEKYFRSASDLQYLNNSDRLNLFIAAACDVGHNDQLSETSLAEKIIMYPNGGSIAAMASTRSCFGGPNTSLYKQVILQLAHENQPVGKALILGKLIYSAGSSNNMKQSLFGDPTLPTNPPQRIGSINLFSGDSIAVDSLKARQRYNAAGNTETATINHLQFFAYEPEFSKIYFPFAGSANDTLEYFGYGDRFFQGSSTVQNGTFNQQFIIPKDVRTGQSGRIIAYAEAINLDAETSLPKTYTLLLDNIHFADEDMSVVSNDIPSIELWFNNNEDFQDGNTIEDSSILKAKISDENGINVLGREGHSIFVIIDDENIPTDVSTFFTYDENSATSGQLNWVMPSLEKGIHTLSLIAYDNLNNPTVKTITFKLADSGISISNLLPYPNPMEKDGHFTFELTQDAYVTIDIFTITGKKIESIQHPFGQRGYNQVYWDGIDADGDRLSNNTYFYKVKAKSNETNQTTEKIEKFIIYH